MAERIYCGVRRDVDEKRKINPLDMREQVCKPPVYRETQSEKQFPYFGKCYCSYSNSQNANLWGERAI